MKNYQKISEFFSGKNKNIIIIVFLVIVLVVLGLLYYKNMKKSEKETDQQKLDIMINTAAEDAAKLDLTEDQRSNLMKENLRNPGHSLPAQEAKAREAEIIKSLYQ